MQPKKVSRQLLKRLSVYLEYLKQLPDSVDHISATAIAKGLGLGDVQVRKDLARASGGGQRRTGHQRERLIQDIESFLDFSTVTRAVLVGSDRLGHVLLDYPGFEKYGLRIEACFDWQSAPTCTEEGSAIYPISQLESYCKTHDVRIGIVAVSAEKAQTVCNQLVDSGIQAIWNFTNTHLYVPQGVAVHNDNLILSAAALRVQLKAIEGE